MSRRAEKEVFSAQHIEATSPEDGSSVEKQPAVVQIDQFQVLGLSREDADFYSSYPADRRKTLVRKVDVRLVPMLAILYLISHLDRANIGNAKIEGLEEDLHLTGIQWNIVTGIFFVPYVLLEIPSNILLKKFKRPSVYLGSLVFAWGIVMTLTGVVQNFAGLAVARVVLGALEAGFYPGAVYLCSYWYMPRELAIRIACFYCTSALSGAFSGLLAAGIAQMRGVGGYNGWRWIFILEGLVTIVLGVVCYLFLIDSPQLSTQWLEPEEIRYLEIQKFIKEGGKFSEEKTEKFRWTDLKAVVTDYKMYMQAFNLMAISACSYGMKFTMPSIVEYMGFESTNANLMTVPPYIAGALSALGFAYLSDKFYWRMPFVAIPLLLIVVAYGTIFPLSHDLKANIGPAYFGVILACMGIYPVQPAGSSWAANNLAGSGKRAIGVAFNICVGNLGGIVGSYIFLDREAPAYPTGFGVSLAFGAAGSLVATLLEFAYWMENKKKSKWTEEEVYARYSQEELRKMGDKSPLFKYTL